MDKPMKGRICLVTGATSGVGWAIAKGLSQLGATIIMSARDQVRGQALAAAMTEATGNANIHFLACDLSLPSSIDIFLETFSSRFGQCHVLAHNAAAFIPNRTTNIVGQEMMWAVNFWGTNHLVRGLLPLLRASSPARINLVCGQPLVFKLTSVRWEEAEQGGPRFWGQRYVKTIKAKFLYGLAMAERLQGSGVMVNVFHPGLVKTNMLNQFPSWMRWSAKQMNLLLSDACPTGLYLASASDLESGFYVDRRRVDYPLSFKDHEFLKAMEDAGVLDETRPPNQAF